MSTPKRTPTVREALNAPLPKDLNPSAICWDRDRNRNTPFGGVHAQIGDILLAKQKAERELREKYGPSPKEIASKVDQSSPLTLQAVNPKTAQTLNLSTVASYTTPNQQAGAKLQKDSNGHYYMTISNTQNGGTATYRLLNNQGQPVTNEGNARSVLGSAYKMMDRSFPSYTSPQIASNELTR